MSPATIIPRATVSGSASSRTTAADLPPNSRLTFRSVAPQAAATRRPAAVEPVKETLSIPGCATRYSPISRPAGRMLTTPGGSSSRSSSSAMT